MSPLLKPSREGVVRQQECRLALNLAGRCVLIVYRVYMVAKVYKDYKDYKVAKVIKEKRDFLWFGS